MAKKLSKSNAMRILETGKIPYLAHTCAAGDKIDGVSVAAKLGLEQDRVFKTLVTQGRSRGYYVFVIPVAAELDLKAAAAAVGEKSVEMLHVKDLNRVTGYLRGGCSPVGMKKQFPTVIDETARDFATITVSGGKIGLQIELDPDDLAKVIGAKFAAIQSVSTEQLP